MHRYTAEQIAYLRRHGTVERKWLAKAFNNHFGTSLTTEAIEGACARNDIWTGRTGQFEKGQLSWNKGVKGSTPGSSTSFRQGHMPHNWRPVGTEVEESKDGYIKVKIGEPKTWIFKHILVWERHHGPLPTGKVVIFADGNKRNFSPENLVAIERRELLFLNRKSLITPDGDLTRVAITLAKLATTAAQLAKKRR